VVGKITGRSLPWAGLRQLLLGGLAVVITYTVGTLIGSRHA
jgi:VIT1/CCC1 family predicted Fe2+/Mn2+ transporter